MTTADTGGYQGEEAAFVGYTSGMNPLAEQLHALAKDSLGEQFDQRTFSKIGDEVGLADALRAATQRQQDRVSGLANSYGGTAEAVRNTWTNFDQTEQDHARNLRRAAGDPQ